MCDQLKPQGYKSILSLLIRTLYVHPLAQITCWMLAERSLPPHDKTEVLNPNTILMGFHWDKTGLIIVGSLSLWCNHITRPAGSAVCSLTDVPFRRLLAAGGTWSGAVGGVRSQGGDIRTIDLNSVCLFPLKFAKPASSFPACPCRRHFPLDGWCNGPFGSEQVSCRANLPTPTKTITFSVLASAVSFTNHIVPFVPSTTESCGNILSSPDFGSRRRLYPS